MPGNRKNPSVIVIGAGMTGVMLVIRLKQAGIEDVILLEKKDSVGGTWRENTYPGIACDVPGHAYTYSFEPNPEWSSLFAPGDEIRQYFDKVFHKYGVDKHAHFNEAVTGCSYDEGSWTVQTSRDKTYHCDILFAATGMLHRPVTPEFPGRDTFAGAQMHSAEWDHSVDMKGKRIGVIGNGSSAAQFIPELIDLEGTDVTVFQRTAQWIVDLPNKRYTEKEKERFRRNPRAIARLKRNSLMIFEYGTSALTSDSWFMRIAHRVMAWNAVRYLNKSVKDPQLRARLTPDYKFGCKRVVINSTFYPAIQKPNAHLETSGIDHIEPNGICSSNGKLHELDVIIYATGFDPAAYMRPMNFTGRDGLSIEEAWSRKVQAYRNICLPGFPNFFLMLGPNSPIGNYSVIAMSEVQADYALQLISQWQAGALQTIEAKPEAMAAWNAQLKAKMGHTVWASGCQSWYLDADGDPLTWPDNWRAWLKEMKAPDPGDFHPTEPCPGQPGHPGIAA